MVVLVVHGVQVGGGGEGHVNDPGGELAATYLGDSLDRGGAQV